MFFKQTKQKTKQAAEIHNGATLPTSRCFWICADSTQRDPQPGDMVWLCPRKIHSLGRLFLLQVVDDDSRDNVVVELVVPFRRQPSCTAFCHLFYHLLLCGERRVCLVIVCIQVVFNICHWRCSAIATREFTTISMLGYTRLLFESSGVLAGFFAACVRCLHNALVS